MATLQKFKFFATQCSVIGSPSRAAPTSSPVIHIRRRKTLRMLLGKASATSTAGNFHRRFLHHQNNRRQDAGVSDSPSVKPPERVAAVGVRSKLKDLFVSSPPEDAAAEKLLKDDGGSVVAAKRGGDGGGGRAFSATLKQRLLMRRAWRPVLVGIPEVSP